MNEQLERRYRRLLLAYPKAWRKANTDNMLATLSELAAPNQTKPNWRDRRSLIANGMRARTFESSGGSPEAAVAEGAMRASLLLLCMEAGSGVAATFDRRVTVLTPHWVVWATLSLTIGFLARPNRWTLGALMLSPLAIALVPETSAIPDLVVVSANAGTSVPNLMRLGVMGLVSLLPFVWCQRSAPRVFRQRRLAWLGLIAVSTLEFIVNIHSFTLLFVLAAGVVGLGVLRLDPRPTATLITTVGLIAFFRTANDAGMVRFGFEAAILAVTFGLLALITRIARPAFAT
jgi:hypothetical protein